MSIDQTTLPIVDVNHLTTTFATPRGPLTAVNDVSLTIQRGRSLGVVGESGSGKTVLSRSIIGLLPTFNVSQTGTAMVNGHQVIGVSNKQLREMWGSEVAMVFQDPMTALTPTKRVGEQIAESLRINLKMSRKDAKARAVELLRQVGIPSPERRAKAYPNQLSGGMRQRVMIAIAIACGPKFLVADEPTTGLDVTVQAQVLDLIGELRRESDLTLILVTHDLGVVATRTDDVAVMYAGRIVEQAPTKELFANVAMPYTKGLLDSTPRIDAPSHTRLTSIDGRPPDLVNPPKGCAFAPRCTMATEKCHEERPPRVASTLSANHLFACWYPLGGHAPATTPSEQQ